MKTNENADAANVGAYENSDQQDNYTHQTPGKQSEISPPIVETFAELRPDAFRLDYGIIETCYPGLGPTVRACLAVCAAMSLRGRARPLSLILEGVSGLGKTAVVQMFMPRANPELKKWIYRSDDFTAKSFVSHAANVKKEDLEQIDLLPKLRNRVLLTKELAPIFHGNEEKLIERFAMLISILDGEGFTSDSGMRGRRGYEEPIMFNWIGATTPLPARTHRMMSQLGTRFLFYEVPTLELTDEELLEYARDGKSDEGARRCNAAINHFLCDFFKLHPVGSVDPQLITFPEALLCEVTRWARLLVKGRAQINRENDFSGSVPVSAAPAEGPWRVVDYFKDLALGNALIDGRTEVIDLDLELVAYVAISSLPGHLRPVVRRLRTVESVSSSDCEGLCRVSRPTARKRLRELELLGIVERISGCPETNQPDSVRLAEQFAWLRTR